MSELVPRVIRPRVIPVLLLRDQLLYKTQSFKNPTYVGDPRVAVKIFNDKSVDEIIVLDINATKQGRAPNFKLIEEIAGEAFMPFTYGGGIRNISDARKLFNLGVEKLVVSTMAVESPDFIYELSSKFGAQSIVVCIDLKKNFFGKTVVVSDGSRKNSKYDPVQFAVKMQEMGAGELIIQSVARDGTMSGFDKEWTKHVSDAVDIPVVALGGASNVSDLKSIIVESGASAAAAGAMFVFQGPHRAVLISYPDEKDFIQ